MGGNALKNTTTRRMSVDEYDERSSEILDRMKHFGYFNSIEIIRSYHTKDSFGDCDILYSTFDDRPLAVEDVEGLFDTNEIVRNTSVISFDYREMQVDFIHIARYEFDYATNYFAFNDCGNFVGRLAHQFGLKHGHNGLYLPLRDGDNTFGEICLSLDHNVTLEFLELDVSKFNAGFETLEDVFRFVRESPFFSPEFYKMENLNTIARMRDRKRSSYNTFLKFNEENPVSNAWVNPHSKEKFRYLERIFREFPEAKLEYIEKTHALAAQRYAKSRFNGDIVGFITGLEGKELGKFMQHLRGVFLLQQHALPLLSDTQIHNIITAEFMLHKG